VTDGRRASLPLACGAALVSGLATSLAFPPAGVWPVAFVGVVPLLLMLRGRTVPAGALIGLCFGAGLFGASLYWIALFGVLAWTALVLLSAASIACFGAVTALIDGSRRPVLGPFAVAAAWTAIDWIRGMWPLGGFTWSALGTSQVNDPTLLPLASVTGVWGVTFAVVFVNAVIAAAIERRGRGPARAALAIVAACLVLAPALLPPAHPDGGEVSIAVVQVDVRPPADISPVEEDLLVAQRNIDEDRTLTSAADRPDLVVWGEGALDPGALEDERTMANVRGAVASVGVPTLAGAVVNDADGSQHTSAIAFDASGTPVDRYDKVHLVPFGEYVPWRSHLTWIDAISQIPVDRRPGESIHTISQSGVPAYGAPICFENAFPSIPRQLVRDGAGFIVVPVNNASYGFTAAAAQHLQLSQMRAVETGRWVVDAAVSGISAFIDPQGGVTSRTDLFDTTVLRGQVVPSTERTPYVRFGDWVPVACVLSIGVALALPRRRSDRLPAPEPLPRPARALAILPTYEERQTIERVVRGVLATPGVDVLVVDDSSPDGTGEIVRAIAADENRVRLLERAAKSGLASAYLEGFRIAVDEGYDVAIEMDSDLSHDPAELPRLLEAADRCDLVVGSRYIRGGSVTDWSRSRVLLSRGGNGYARAMLGLPIHDATSGYRVYRRRLLETLLERPFAAEGYGFQIELVSRAQLAGARVGEAPITFREREAGYSKISRTIVVEALWMVTRWGVELRLRSRARL
jgi:apolipoprotein N-acyltransferase